MSSLRIPWCCIPSSSTTVATVNRFLGCSSGFVVYQTTSGLATTVESLLFLTGGHEGWAEVHGRVEGRRGRRG
ncbi:unnamed protein product [Ascophyllum nodosum]